MRSPLSKVCILFYDHVGEILWGEKTIQKALDSAIDWMKKYPTFKIGMESEAWCYDYLAESNPRLLDSMRQACADFPGRFGIGTCTYGQPLSVFVDGESNIRQLWYGLDAMQRHFGFTPPIYVMSEHALHAQIPQLINGFGFKGAIMRTFFMMYGYNPMIDAATVWWQGIDGSKSFAIPTYVGGGVGFGRISADNWILTRYPSKLCMRSLEPYRRQHSAKGIDPILAARCDDVSWRHEPLAAEYDGKSGYEWILLEDIAKKFPRPKLSFVTMPGDFAVRMPWGYCGNEIWNTDRKAIVRAQSAERLAAAIAMATGKGSCGKLLDEAWKNLLVGQHHDIQIMGLLPESRRFHRASLDASQQAIAEAAATLSQKKPSANEIVLFNPLQWPRTHAIFSLSGRAVRETIAEVPGLACAGIARPRHNFSIRATSRQQTITTRFWEVCVDESGTLASLRNPQGKDLLDPTEPNGSFAASVNGSYYSSKGRLTGFARTRHATVLFAEGTIECIPYQSRITVYDYLPRIDFECTFAFNNERIGKISADNTTLRRKNDAPCAHEEKLRIRFYPLVARQDAYGIYDHPFCIAQTSNRVIQGNYWTALSDGQTGLAILNKGTMGSIVEDNGAFSVPLAYALDKDWHPKLLEGDFTFEISIVPFEGLWKDADIVKHAMEFNFPCIPVNARLKALPDPIKRSAIALSSGSVMLSALYNHHGQTYARFCETLGSASEVKLTLAKSNRLGPEVNLNHKPIGPKPGKTSKFKPWQIRTFAIENDRN